MDRPIEDDRPRLTRAAGLALAALAALAAAAGDRTGPSFTVAAPETMVTGRVRLEADTRDARVESVRWEVDDWARTTPRPFAFEFDLGPVPREATVRAIALDSARLACEVYTRGGTAAEYAERLRRRLKSSVGLATAISRLICAAPNVAQAVRLWPGVMGVLAQWTRVPQDV